MLGLKILAVVLINAIACNAFWLRADDDPATAESEFYEKCASNPRACYGYPANCTTDQSCVVAGAFEKGEGVFHFYAITNGSEYVAIGFNPDNAGMPEKDKSFATVVCYQDNTDVKATLAVTVRHEESEVIFSTETTGFNVVSSKAESPFVYCHFTLADSVKINDVELTLGGDKDYYLVGAAGSTAKDDNGVVTGVDGHSKRHFDSVCKVLGSKTTDGCGDGAGGKTPEDEFYEKCALHPRACFGHPENCTTDHSCDVAGAFEKGEGVFNFYAITDGSEYVAIGFNPDKAGMPTANSSFATVVCYQDNTEAKATLALTVKTDESEVVFLTETEGFSVVTSKAETPFLYCHFTLADSVKFDDVELILGGGQDYYLVGAAGSTIKNETGAVVGVGGHSKKHFDSGCKLLSAETTDGCKGGAGVMVSSIFLLSICLFLTNMN